jgi:hypothetical protein
MERSAHARYLLRIAIFAALLVVIGVPGYIQIAPENFASRDHTLWATQVAWARTPSQDDPEILILGDSRVQAGLMPARLDRPARSLALPGATPIDAYYLFEDYLEAHAAPERLLISFAPIFLEWRSTALFWAFAVKFKAHDWADFQEIARRSRKLGVPLEGRAGDLRVRADWLLYHLNFPPYHAAELKNARWFSRRGRNERLRRTVEADAGYAVYSRKQGADGLAHEAGLDDFAPSPLVDAYLRDLLALAHAHDVDVLVTAMPVSETSAAAITPAYRASYAAYMSALEADHPWATFDPEIGSLPDVLFGDANHLNEAGALEVTAALAPRLH